jgi:hypothetical protein
MGIFDRIFANLSAESGPPDRSRVVLAPVAGAKLVKILRARPGWQSPQSADDGDKTNSSPRSAVETVKTIYVRECRVISVRPW